MKQFRKGKVDKQVIWCLFFMIKQFFRNMENDIVVLHPNLFEEDDQKKTDY